MVKFIHCADLHLDSPFKTHSHLSENIYEDVKKSTYESFKTLVNFALQEEVDFIVIAGDVFDDHNRTLRAEVFLKEQFERLKKEQIFVYMCHGNHDPLSDSVVTDWPENVSVFDKNVETYQTITKNGEKILLHGFSYQDHASYENKLDEYPSSQGVKGLHIGVLHGTYSKSSTKHRYTEFRLEDLNSKLYHYWALGHIHERQQINDMPPTYYPGNIQGRHFNEMGDKGFLLVEGDEFKLNVEFVPSHFIRFDEIKIETKQTTKQGIYDVVQKFKNQVRKQGKAIYRVYLEIDSDEPVSSQDLMQVEAMLKEYEENENNFVFIESLIVSYKDDDTRPLEHEFSQELKADDAIFTNAMSDLYLNPKATKFLDNYDDFDKVELINRAEALLKSGLRGEQS
ncbi:DNA repair exonuclease [Staphylococcus simulans]|uniref:metallophosphoesterase family protein n=1 Tax=Staphylococcus simulans TaxID=1286 RepID=UPI000D1D3142|nr:DNA repair exonuclease [Staphylococcus simulans]PTJ75416.1 DNA repair exonuclease [Staphylococcus simulans]